MYIHIYTYLTIYMYIIYTYHSIPATFSLQISNSTGLRFHQHFSPGLHSRPRSHAGRVRASAGSELGQPGPRSPRGQAPELQLVREHVYGMDGSAPQSVHFTMDGRCVPWRVCRERKSEASPDRFGGLVLRGLTRT